jgi:hypothetical protein
MSIPACFPEQLLKTGLNEAPDRIRPAAWLHFAEMRSGGHTHDGACVPHIRADSVSPILPSMLVTASM